ncbi:MAG: hypothetical protein AB2L18_02165 [Anaerolineaceae bacterium]
MDVLRYRRSPHSAFLSGSRKSKLSDLFKTQAEVEIMDASISDEQLCLLVPLGFYLYMLHANNDTAIAAAAGASLRETQSLYNLEQACSASS